VILKEGKYRRIQRFDNSVIHEGCVKFVLSLIIANAVSNMSYYSIYSSKIIRKRLTQIS